jgi:dihydropteroate synthase
MIIGGKHFDTNHHVYIMGILNVTPDSFSDGGNYNRIDRALYRVEEMIKQGADMIDVGGESTRPNHVKISDAEEIDRVSPIIEQIKVNFDIPVSLDSYKSTVIEANLGRIDLINDIWGLKYDPRMAQVIAQSKLPCCLMHNRFDRQYIHFFDDFLSDIKETVQIAEAAGIEKDQIIIDGGVGFQKSFEQNLEVINKTNILCELGFPVMIASSRKSFIGYILDRTVDNRLYGTLATTVVGVMKGASFIRVHDIEENGDVIKMTKSILEEKKWIKSK